MNSMRILLVDDDAFLRDMYAMKFKEHGDEVAVAESGELALQMITESPFDAIVVDMVMPAMSGLDLIKKVQESHSEKGNKCIILSNQGEDADIDAAKQAGAVGYIIKADSIPSEVVSKVHELIT